MWQLWEAVKEQVEGPMGALAGRHIDGAEIVRIYKFCESTPC